MNLLLAVNLDQATLLQEANERSGSSTVVGDCSSRTVTERIFLDKVLPVGDAISTLE